ncbi:hypothetical protein MUK42_04678 [Musa troglodytarum]|uniref:Protein MIZU-KUSSEI 1 n=1 Tax=Musa troglodytarum TaxID=320322 RepID=A0A9E7GFG2_9LILI|nr:hypothetical protein MUK42_04678 [Musa troglodytarum]
MAASSTATAIVLEPGESATSTHAEHWQPMCHCPSSQLSLVPPSAHHLRRRRRRPARVLRLFHSFCRTLPIFTPKCKLPDPCRIATSSPAVMPTIACTPATSLLGPDHRGRRRHHDLITGTIFGYRNGRVSFSLQENPRCLPSLVIELAMHTHALLREMSAGMVRIALECEKRPLEHSKETNSQLSSNLMDEPLWAMFCNGKKSGYCVRREASDEDLAVMEMLRPVSMGAGVLPGRSEEEGPDGEMAYVRAGFEHVVGSRDSETLFHHLIPRFMCHLAMENISEKLVQLRLWPFLTEHDFCWDAVVSRQDLSVAGLRVRALIWSSMLHARIVTHARGLHLNQ